ncbi:MAG: hypothetical protein J7M14_05785, partial [Planctomycetes bacterium]|nr:hypothetical protein [Planctomycetota bacterium]
MKNLDNKGVIIGLACALMVIALWRGADATSAESGSPLRWEYAQLRIQGDNIVFSQGAQESIGAVFHSKPEAYKNM